MPGWYFWGGKRGISRLYSWKYKLAVNCSPPPRPSSRDWVRSVLMKQRTLAVLGWVRQERWPRKLWFPVAREWVLEPHLGNIRGCVTRRDRGDLQRLPVLSLPLQSISHTQPGRPKYRPKSVQVVVPWLKTFQCLPVTKWSPNIFPNIIWKIKPNKFLTPCYCLKGPKWSVLVSFQPSFSPSRPAPLTTLTSLPSLNKLNLILPLGLNLFFF